MKSAHEVWLIDVSGSMNGDPYRRLKDQLKKLLDIKKESVVLIAFSTVPEVIGSIDDLPPPHGGTNLTEALEAALEYFPGKAVVFSDGSPDCEDSALVAAQAMPGVVDTVFFGRETDTRAIAFMEKLARNNGGRSASKDVTKGVGLLCEDVKELLGLPAPISL
jgi:hypothetical protein